MTDAPIVLSVEKITKHFGGVVALDDVSIDVRRGETLGLVGPNGAGKSVLVNIMSGHYPPSQGRVLFEGADITDRPTHAFSRHGVVRTYQNLRLFRRMSVIENVLTACGDHVGRPLSSLFSRRGRSDLAEAHALLARLHLTAKADDNAGSLSYGDARRLEIARALATKPKLLLLDEPAAGMNDRETEQLRNDIVGLRRDVAAIVVIEHDVQFLRSLSDRLIVLDYGRKITEGSPDIVLKDPRVVAAYIGEDDDE